MKLKKLVAVVSAAAMLGSLVVALPASADEFDTGAVAAKVSAQVRANDSEFTTKNNVTIKTDGANIEMTQKEGVYFGAYYSYDADDLNIPAGAVITSATLTIEKYDSFSGRAFNVRPVTITDAASTNGDTIFNAVTAAYADSYVTSNTSASGDPVVADVTSIFDATKDNAFFVTNATVENSKRQLKADATLDVKYTYNAGDAPTATPGPAAGDELEFVLPDTADVYLTQRSTDGGETFASNNGARAVTNANNGTFVYGVKVQDTNQYKITQSANANDKSLANLKDDDDTNKISFGNTRSMYIPFGSELAVTEINVTTDAKNALILALVKSDDLNTENIGVVNDTDAVLPIVKSDNWFRLYSTTKKVDSNYTYTTNDTTFTSTLALNDGGTAEKYAGLFIDNNNGTGNITGLTIKYQVEGEPTAEPTSAPTVAPDSVASAVVNGETTYYTNFEEAVAAADADTTVTLLKDVTLTARLNVEKNLTIAGEDVTITGKNNTTAILAKANLTIDGVDVVGVGTGIAVQVEGTKTLTIKDATITGKVRQGNGNNTVINLDNTTVNGVVETRRGADVATTGGSYATINLTNNSSADEVIYYSGEDTNGKKDAVNVDGTSTATLTDKYAAATEEPTQAPTAEPTADPTQEPTAEPTADPTQEPTAEPTADPTQEPTAEPTADPTQEPTAEPTADPTQEPTAEPTADPTQEPTAEPTADPTQAPTAEPTADPTQAPTAEPTADPTQAPTAEPTSEPTTAPAAPTNADAEGDYTGTDGSVASLWTAIITGSGYAGSTVTAVATDNQDVDAQGTAVVGEGITGDVNVFVIVNKAKNDLKNVVVSID